MIASEIIGLTALLLALVLFYTRLVFAKLRNVFILILSFASAGLIGYSSASSIGIGWTVSIALLIFLGVAGSILYLQRREDQKIEQYFDLVIKSEEPLMATQTESFVTAPFPTADSKTAWSAIVDAPAVTVRLGQQNVPAAAESTVVSSTDLSGFPHPGKKKDFSMTELQTERETGGEENTADLSLKVVPAASEPQLEASEAEAVPASEPQLEASEAEAVPASEPQLEASEAEAVPASEPESAPALVAFEMHEAAIENGPIAEQIEEARPEMPTSIADRAVLPEDRERIQTLSANAERALQQGDFLRAYQSLREALTYSPPVMATYLLSRQLVQVLNEMGLYEESISVLEKVLKESPSLSAKKREEFSRQISYLEALILQLQLENKRNLSWSLVPPAVHQKVIAHFRTLFAANGTDLPSAIPFH